MRINLTKKNFFISFTLVIGLSALIVLAAIKIFWPLHYFGMYPFIPIFFYIFGWYALLMFDNCRRKAPHKLLEVYMGIKFVKMGMSIVIILLYTLHVTNHKEDFLVVFFLFYIITMVYQTIFFVLYECNKKRQKQIKNV